MPDIIKSRLRLINISGALCLVLVVCATVFMGILPLYSQTIRNRTASNALEQDLSKLNGLSNTLNQVETELKSTESRLQQAETRFPTSSAMEDFMTQLAKAADDAGLQVISISPQTMQNADNYKVMPLQITGTGSFENCYKFLTALRKMSRLTRLDDLALQLDTSMDKAQPDQMPVCKIIVGISTFTAR